MTPPPTAPPIRAPRLGIVECVCWILLGFIVALPLAMPDLARSRSSALAPSTAPTQLPQPAPEFLLQSRYDVGVNQLHLAGESTLRDLADLPQQSAHSLADRFRALLVKRDLLGTAPADPDIEEIAHDDLPLSPDARFVLHQDDPSTPLDGLTSTTEQFRARHGWFADLALSQGLSASDPRRAAALRPATRTLMVMVSAMGIVGLAGLGGFVLLIVLIVRFAIGKLHPAPLSLHAAVDRRPYLVGFILYLACLIAVPLILLRLGTSPLLAILILYFLGPILALLWPLIRGHSWRTIRMTVGLHLGKGFFREVSAGILGYLAGLPLLACGLLITVILLKITHGNASHPIENEISTKPLQLALLFALASVYAPITEELLFRGFFYAHLRSRLGYVLSAIMSSLVFAAIHPQGWIAIPVLGSIAFTLATLREFRGSLLPGMTAHALNNTFVLTLLAFAIS